MTPTLDDMGPAVSAALDLVLPAPIGRRRATLDTLADLERLIDRCGDEHPARRVDDLRVVLPRLRAQVELDVAAALEGDPSCVDAIEAALCLPGVHALAIHRIAHELHAMGVPLLPRLLAAGIHRRTAIDIHPAASIGHSILIDHGTGVVIGATAVIGDHCTLYQGVTLGAARVVPGMDPRRKRHPTLEDHVIVYAGATILGGETVVGAGSVIGGGVVVTESVPPRHVVTTPRPDVELRRTRRPIALSYAI